VKYNEAKKCHFEGMATPTIAVGGHVLSKVHNLSEYPYAYVEDSMLVSVHENDPNNLHDFDWS
jgi:hypothetical protein